MPQQTIFSKIIAGTIPCHKVYEDEHVIAFLDIAPLSAGHTLLVPKEPAATLDALSEQSATAIGRILPALCRAVQAVSGTSDYNVLQNNGARANQAVPHVHFHIIPRPHEHAGLTVQWQPGDLSADDGAQLAARLSAHIRGEP